MNFVFIYALNDLTSGKTRYIGKTVDPYLRYEQHLAYANSDKTFKGRWLRKLLSNNQYPILEVLDSVPEKEWQVWEQQWIRLYRLLGFKLTNTTSGGEGGFIENSRSPEALEKKRASMSGANHPNFGKHLSALTREKLSNALKGRYMSPEHRAKIGAKHKGFKFSDASRAKMSASQKKRFKKESVI